jgi:putative heme-binding domain-containing protein
MIPARSAQCLLSVATSICLLSTCAIAQDTNQKPVFYLPQNPVAAAYVLSRLSNQELTAAPRSEFVYVALLQRKGLERKYRLEALDGLAKARNTDSLTELIAALTELDKKGENSADTLRDIAPVLLQKSAAELAGKRAALENLVRESQLPLTRQIGFAAHITADQSIDPAWKQTDANPSQLPDLILGIPLLREPTLRASTYPRIEPLTHSASSPEIRRAAITVMASVPGHETETFKTLSNLAQQGTERPTVLASLQKIPKEIWPKDDLVPLANSLLDYLEKTPADQRTDRDFLNALQFATELSSVVPEDFGRPLAKKLRTLGPAIFVLHAVYEQMRYDKQLLVVEAAKPVAITLENDDAMPHNVAILAPGALEEIGSIAEKMPSEPDSQGRLYVPDSPKVLHASKLVSPGQKLQIAFTAPAEPGEYTYVCTFPGHWRRMVGTLLVVKDMDAYLATAGTAQQPQITEWQLSELAPDLPKVAVDRNLENGKELFTKLACAQCHKLGSQGYAYGPELTDVLVRYKHDRTNVLEQILEPSKTIDDRYRNYSFELKNGDESVIGMILKEDADTLSIQTGPADSLVQKLKKSGIEKRTPQASSPMPIGLLNTLSKDQILDLLAYIESAGAPPAPAHAH